jgi:beta-phosphoglucomutase family hydrolase
MLRAVIFDMDGLMIDTERLHHESFKTVLEQHGITPVPNAMGVIHTSGISAEANWEHFKKEYALDADTEELTKAKNDAHLKLLKTKVEAMPGLLGLLKNLKANGYKVGIASSSIREHIDLVTDRLGIGGFFDAITSGDEVTNGKPAPDIFLKAATKLGAKPAECVVLEDAMNGMRAGKAAGMFVIVVPNEFTKNEDFGMADLIVSSLADVNGEKLATLAI